MRMSPTESTANRPRIPTAVCVLISAWLILPAALHAQATLFVNSAPIRAEVTINGTAYGATPLLLRDLAPGTYEVTALKPGHRPRTARVELADQEVSAVELRPEPDSFVGAFSADETVAGGDEFSRQEAVLELPSGTYRLTAEGSTLRLDPVYPLEGALTAARLVTIAGGLVSAIATVEDVLVRSDRSYFTSYLPSPATIASWTLTAAAGGFWIALEAERADYQTQVRVRQFQGDLTAAEAEASFLEAETALEAGNLARALTGYTRVVARGGDSEYVPDSLYKSAQIYSVSGDLGLAAELLELLVAEYPAPAVYDRGLRLLADLRVSLGDDAAALDRLEEMVFYDPVYERDDIEAEIQAIRTRQEASE